MMKKLMSFVMSAAALVMSASVMADSDRRGPDVRPMTNPLYQSECGSCHFAFQAGFLPARSWKKMMSGLEDHFGDNAELPEDERLAIETYLVANAADKASERRSQKFMRSIGDSTPLRITEVRYFRKEHDEVPQRVLKHEQIGSLSNCMACHTKADTGSYAERDIRIPGVGRWEDD